MTHSTFPHLFAPLTIRSLELKNRIAISGHHAGWWVDGGPMNAAFAAYIEERAKGGVGLFVIGCTSPEPGSGWLENVDDRVIPAYQRCADAGHRHGAAVFAQLCHPGFHPLPGPPVYQAHPTAPSIHPVHYKGPERHIPTRDELKRLVASFGAAGARAAAGGVDGIEIHSHEFFLHSQMLNPLYNQREDEYGGSLENRIRFLMETLQAIRDKVGPGIVMGVRLKADDVAQRGLTTDDYKTVAQRLEDSGLIDYINFSGGDGRHHHGPMPRPEGEWIPLVQELRPATKLVLMHTGRMVEPHMAEAAIADGIFDVACMTKAHIADPHFALKVYENRLDDIRFCTRCLQSCIGKMHLMTCVYNPLTSRETIWSDVPPAETPKRVLVIGAGPAGMEAALTAARRGHDVTVYERSSRIGGQIWAGASSPGRRTWGRIAEYYERQAAKGIVNVVLNTEATPDLIQAFAPDELIIATGSRPNRLTFLGGPETRTVAETVLGEGSEPLPSGVVLLDREGFSRALVAADFLSCKGVKVYYVTPHLEVGPLVETLVRNEFFTIFAQRGVEFLPGTEVAAWDGPDRVIVRSVQTGEEQVLTGIGQIVAAAGSTSENALAQSLRGIAPSLHVIGDANSPATVEAATYQGARLGRLL